MEIYKNSRTSFCSNLTNADQFKVSEETAENELAKEDEIPGEKSANDYFIVDDIGHGQIFNLNCHIRLFKDLHFRALVLTLQ